MTSFWLTVLDWLRRGYAFWFIASAFINVSHGIYGKPKFPPVLPQGQALLDALSATNFLWHLLGAAYLVGGFALLFWRTAPLGIVILAGPVSVILLFHLMLSGMQVYGLIFSAGFAIVAFSQWRRLAVLWSSST
jgi:hypothetical protein